jgi:hypothetical protein
MIDLYSQCEADVSMLDSLFCMRNAKESSPLSGEMNSEGLGRLEEFSG